MLRMAQALDRIKGDTAPFLDANLLRAVSREVGLTGRNRLLTPDVLGRHDQVVEYFKPAERPDWLDPKE